MKFFTALSLTTIIFLLSFSNPSYCIELSEKPPVASFSIGAEYSSGNYDSDSTTRRTYVPLVFSLYPYERLDVSIELPFIYQNSSGTSASNTTTAKTVARGSSGSGASINAGVPNVTLLSNTVQNSPNTSTHNASVSGLGDIILRGGYILFVEENSMPQIRTSMLVKTPSASVSDGLGTGEFDFGAGLDLTKWFGSLRLAGEAVYNYQGKVAGWGLKNYLNYSCTVGYQATKSIQPMLVVNGASALSANSDDLLEVRGRIFWNISQITAIDIFASRGISSSSPDYAGGLALIYSF
jgi:hypothetical protein